jgi:hypothetical protein
MQLGPWVTIVSFSYPFLYKSWLRHDENICLGFQFLIAVHVVQSSPHCYQFIGIVTSSTGQVVFPWLYKRKLPNKKTFGIWGFHRGNSLVCACDSEKLRPASCPQALREFLRKGVQDRWIGRRAVPWQNLLTVFHKNLKKSTSNFLISACTHVCTSY